jgi:phage terminase large subunit-like protein
VASGKKIAGPHVRDACARHLQDLKTGGERGLTFDRAAADRAIDFFRVVLRLNGGEFEGAPFELLDWQKFIVGSLFGWKGADGWRRFRVAYVETAKGSGKSPLAAGIGMYGLVADGEARAEIYAAATKKDQAMVLFRDAVAMWQQSPALHARLTTSGTGENVWNLAYLEKGSFFRPISATCGRGPLWPSSALMGRNQLPVAR